jgi:ATP-binding cassette subfamily C protein
MNSALAPAQQQPASSELAAALGACRRAFVATAVFSGMSNVLMLTGALFMLHRTLSRATTGPGLGRRL